ncbi:glycoside hydrolase family 55 protein [Allobaculum sp. Allo2]|uniref:glycoside hydrolase family 55 protein n=1 Tax=Allobaculum sp. Allo2 TaxID=2853432 RepID=UPI001F615114|nr:glycoside hydrolase family 55 protein [Allobaculum sp. Allo2]UNT92721.1 glycoside hydrolase family 55 protein [Allobaculum sp. Allo2]
MKRPGRLMLSLGLLSSVAASTVLPLSESLILPLYANDSDEAQVIHASDFGADPTGTKDSTQAIQKHLPPQRTAGNVRKAGYGFL